MADNVTYTVIVSSTIGLQLITISDDSILGLEYSRSVNKVGVLKLMLDALEFPPDSGLWGRDTRLFVLRNTGRVGSQIAGDTTWFVRRIQILDKAGESEKLIITAFDGISLLSRHIVAYPSNAEPPNQAYTEKDGQASSLMFEVVRENMIDLMLVGARSFAPYLTYWQNPFAGPNLKISIAWNNCLDVLQEIAALSAAQGVYLAFDVISTNSNNLIFRVYNNQRGTDKRQSVQPTPADPNIFYSVTLSVDNGSLSEVLSDLDYSNEITHIYIGGQGTGTERVFVDLGDPTRDTLTPFNRIEEFRSASGDFGHGDDPFQLLEAARYLREGRPREQWTASVDQTPQLQFGVHYGYGDYVSIQVGRSIYDARIDAFRVTYGTEGERIDVKLRSNA